MLGKTALTQNNSAEDLTRWAEQRSHRKCGAAGGQTGRVRAGGDAEMDGHNGKQLRIPPQ